MARRRAALRPEDSATEGQRRLRVLLRRKTFGELARVLLIDESHVRMLARGKRKPGHSLRGLAHVKLGIPENAWDQAPIHDTYEADDPETVRAVK